VNLFVALFNFVPLLPLDGGHVAAALYEAIRRGLARILGRPDPVTSTPQSCCLSRTLSAV
jgi:membrane-associated protease RseP (regulator of RpoE activity)